jgi:hypothetical protein
MPKLITQWGYEKGKPTYRAVQSCDVPGSISFSVERRYDDILGGDSWRKSPLDEAQSQFNSIIHDLIKGEQVLMRPEKSRQLKKKGNKNG